MNTTTATKLTKPEVEILLHRLGVPDSLADALSDDPDEGVSAEYLWSEVHEADTALWHKLQADSAIDFTALTPLQRDILRDCLEGATFFSDSDDAVTTGEITKGKLLNWKKAALSLERKFEAGGIARCFVMMD